MSNNILMLVVIGLFLVNVFMVVTDKFMIRKMKQLLSTSKRIEAEYTAKYAILLDELEKNKEDAILADLYRSGKTYWLCDTASPMRISAERPKCNRNNHKPRRVVVCDNIESS